MSTWSLWRFGQKEPGPWFNIKMLYYQYRKSHCGVKTVLRSSYLHNAISYTGKMASLYWFCPQLPKQGLLPQITAAPFYINPSGPELFVKNLRTCLHFLPFLDIEFVEVVEIIPKERQGAIYATWSVAFIVMQGDNHHQLWYWHIYPRISQHP